MNAAEHRAEAETLLVNLRSHVQTLGSAEWQHVMATRALAHATLAAIPDPVMPIASVELTWNPKARGLITTTNEPIYGDASGADQLPQVIAYQGKAVPQPCGDKFTVGDARQLDWHLKNTEDSGPFDVLSAF